MKALHYIGTRQLEWLDIPAPKIETEFDAILVPTAVSMCDLDHNIVRGVSPFPGPFVLGHEFVARVKLTGSAVRTVAAGDAVLASFQPSCGHCVACNAAKSSVCREVPNTSMYGIGAAGGNWGGAMADEIRVPWADINLRKIPEGISSRCLAPASDNLADALRCVERPLAEKPDATVLIMGQGSIPLYAVLCARHLGAGRVVLASTDTAALEIAEACGAEVMAIDRWPRKLGSFDITVDCTNAAPGLQACIRSTAPFGVCTSASIFFGEGTKIPLGDMYMKGIEFHTGRVNSASQLDRVIELVASGLDPDLIQPQYLDQSDAINALLAGSAGQKLIFLAEN